MISKTISFFVLLILNISTIAACDSNTKALIFPSNFDIVEPENPLILPYEEDFESGIFKNVQDFTPFYKWQIIEENKNKILKCIAYNEKEVIDGANIICLMVGDKSWQNYSFSFDFKLEGETWIIFAPYADTNHENNTPDYFESRNPWALRLNSNGELIYETVFEHGTHYIKKSPESIEGYIQNDWNHIELMPNGLDLYMQINGVDVGKVAELQENISGRVSIGGGVGCMFDNLKVESLN